MLSKKNNIIHTCILLLHLLQSTLSQSLPQKPSTSKPIKYNKLNLLNLSKHWTGSGTSVLYPKTLKILARKLPSQSGLFTTTSPLPGGVNWALLYNFSLKCLKSSQNASIGFFLSFNNPSGSSTEYGKMARSGLFGFPQALDGLAIVFRKNELRVGMFMKPHLEERELLGSSKVCKEFLSRNGDVRVKVKYTQGSIVGVYTYDERGNEKLCVQFTDVNRYQNFFLSVSGKDVEGECSAEMDLLDFFTHEPIQVIPEKDKKKGDPFFSYFEKSKISEHNIKWKHQQELFKQHHENGKLMASKLLDFADYSQIDFYDKIQNDLRLQTAGIEVSLEVLEREARTMQMFSEHLVNARKDTKRNIEDVFNEMIDFLIQVDSTYEEVDKSTNEIFNLVKAIELPNEITRIFEKTEKIANKLEDFLFKKEKFMKDTDLKSLRSEKVKKVQKFLGKLFEIEKDHKKNFKRRHSKPKEFKQISMKKITKRKLEYFRKIGTAILGIIGGAILVGFLVMYLKIRKAIRHKQIL